MPKRPSRGRSKARGAPRSEPAAPIDAVVPPPPPPAPIPPPVVRAPLWPPALRETEATVITPSPQLADALSAVVTRAAQQTAIDVMGANPKATTPRAVPSGWLAAALTGWILVAAMVLVEPAIARGPVDRPWRPPPTATEASLRYGLWLARARVDALVRAEGRVPPRLGDVGVMDTSLTLTVTGQRTYRIEGRDGALRLSLTSTMAADSFLGTSLDVLRK